MDLLSVGATGLRRELLTNPQLVALLPDENGKTKVYFEAAEGLADPPYVLMHHIWGGDMNEAPSETFDMLWRVDAIAENLVDARNMLTLAYDTVKGSELNYPDGWSAWSKITSNGNYLEQVVVQGKQYWAIGFFARLRGSKPA